MAAQERVTGRKVTQFDRIDALRSPKLTAVVADLLRRKIISGELQQGDNLPPEPELMVQLGVSRPTLREALRVLESESLIRPRRGSRTGAEVCAPSVALSARYVSFILQHDGVTIDDVLQARNILEPPLAGLVASKRDPVAVQALDEALAAEKAALADDVAFGEASIRFHEVIAEHAGVATLALTVRQFNWVLGRLTRAAEADAVEPGPSNALAHKSHERFVRLLQRATPGEVEAFWGEHVVQIGRHLLKGRQGMKVIDIF